MCNHAARVFSNLAHFVWVGSKFDIRHIEWDVGIRGDRSDFITDVVDGSLTIWREKARVGTRIGVGATSLERPASGRVWRLKLRLAASVMAVQLTIILIANFISTN